MKKILIVIGTRPEAIKMASVINLLKESASVEVKVCVTAQHRQMLDQVLDIFKIKPDYDFDLMMAGQDLTDITTGVMSRLRELFKEWSPNLVLVHGDTTTAMAAALSAFYQKIPVAHVEAGLRTESVYSPWPEEINRRIVSRLSSVHFAPTETARKNLEKENCPPNNIYVTGNTVIDSLLSIVDKIENDLSLNHQLNNKFSFINKNKRLILVTGHRRENFGLGFINICNALLKLSERNDVEIVYPVHLNPNVLEPVTEMLRNKNSIHLIQPLDYVPFVFLMKQSFLILTDSGGIQEEAPALGKPVLVMRDNTERPEAIEAGTAQLVGTKSEDIVKACSLLLDDEVIYEKMSRATNPYGDGLSAKIIVDIICKI